MLVSWEKRVFVIRGLSLESGWEITHRNREYHCTLILFRRVLVRERLYLAMTFGVHNVAPKVAALFNKELLYTDGLAKIE